MNTEQNTYTVLRQMILNGDLKRDQYHSEVTLSQQLNISRTPVRYALKQLEQDHLITYHRNKGIRIRQATPSEVKDATQMLLLFVSNAIEPLLLGKGTVNFSLLNQLCTLGYQYRDVGDIVAYAETIHEIYITLMEPLNNQTIINVSRRVSLQTMTSAVYINPTYRKTIQPKPQTTIQQLAEFIAALKIKDTKRARKLFDAYQAYAFAQIEETGSLL